MAFKDDLEFAVKRALRILQRDTAAMNEVATDRDSLTMSVVILAIGGLAFGIGRLLTASFAWLIVGPIMAVGFSFIGVAIWYGVGLLFKPDRWDFMELYRTCAHSSLLSWASLLYSIPLLGVLVGLVVMICQLFITVLIVETLSGLARRKAIAVVLIPAVVGCCLAGIGFGVRAVLGVGAAALQ